MAELAIVATIASAAMSIAGGVMQANSSLAMGEAATKQAEFKRKQLEQQSNEARASAQRGAEDERRKGMLANSTLQARAAASGAGATDDTVINLGSDIAARGEYNALGDMYNGENRARGITMQAEAATFDGQIAKMGYDSKASASLIGGFGDAFGKFASASPFKTSP